MTTTTKQKAADAVHNLIKRPDQAPVVITQPEAEEKKLLKDSYDRQTYWLRKEYIEKIRDYAYTERLSIRKAVNKLIGIALDQVAREYQKENKQLLHYEEGDEL